MIKPIHLGRDYDDVLIGIDRWLFGVNPTEWIMLDVQEPIVKAKKEVKEALRQLGIINKVRNDILHYGIDLNRKEKIITNQMKALSRSRITRTKISSSVIAFMVSDVAVILEVLAQQIVGNSHLDIVDVIC